MERSDIDRSERDVPRRGATGGEHQTGNFSWPDPAHHAGEKISLTPEALHLLFDGVDLRGATLRPWYQRDEK